MEKEKIKEYTDELIKQFGLSGTAVITGIKESDLPAAAEGETKDAAKLCDFIEARRYAYENYTEEQCGLLFRLEQFIAECGSAAKAAKALGETPSTLSDIRKYKYRGKVDEFFSRLNAYFNLKSERDKTYKCPFYVPTSVSEKIYQTIRGVHIVGSCEFITGDTGVGKTRTIHKYVKDYPDNTVFITSNYADRTVGGIMEKLAAALGISGIRGLKALTDAVLDRLHDGMLIIIDEAQHLTFTAIDHLRCLSDEFGERGETMGVCFVGNPALMNHFTEKKIALTGQAFGRGGLRPYIRAADTTLDDIRLMFPELNSDDKRAELKFLHIVAQTNGEGLRRAVNMYTNAYDSNGGEVTAEYLAGLAQLGNLRIPNIGAVIRSLREVE